MYRVTTACMGWGKRVNSNTHSPFSAVILSARLSARVRNPDMERIIILFVILSGATAQPKNLAVGAFNIIIYASLDSSASSE